MDKRQYNKALRIIKQRRRSLGRSQDDVALLTGLHRITVNRIERGQHIPKVETFIDILNACDLDMQIIEKPKSE